MHSSFVSQMRGAFLGPLGGRWSPSGLLNTVGRHEVEPESGVQRTCLGPSVPRVQQGERLCWEWPGPESRMHEYFPWTK